MADSEMTEAWRRGDVAALERLGCKVGGGAVEASSQPSKPSKRRQRRSFVSPSVTVDRGKLIVTVPVEVKSESNQRGWAKIAGRAVGVKRAVREVMGPHAELLVPYTLAYHDGHALRLTFTRLGGKKLDVMANLGRAMKAVEDSVAGALMADDGYRWIATAAQEIGGDVGVRIEIEVA